MGDKVQTTFLESVPEGAESEATFERLAREGNKIIFATSFGYMDQMLAVAAKSASAGSSRYAPRRPATADASS